MIKNILVPQDGSDNGRVALDYGVWLAKKFGAGLMGLHVIDVVALEGPFLHDLSGSLGFEPFLNFSSRMREALELRGKTILAVFEEVCSSSGLLCESSIAFGVVPNEICEKAKIADLTIIGKRGINAKFEYGLLGSTTESVLRKSPKPVMIVPEAFKEPSNPLLAYDGSPTASRAMHSAAEWAKTMAMPLTVLTVSSQTDTDLLLLKNAEDYLRPYEIKARFVHLKGDPPLEIERYYKKNGHDLLFMGTSHHSRIVEMVLGSTTEHVMRNVDGPFFLER
ncbi:MAG: universal stress protein [Deltaproteobacteria bacterium]|nr:universal stress protein [Deltaproteobacteria bacterium]